MVPDVLARLRVKLRGEFVAEAGRHRDANLPGEISAAIGLHHSVGFPLVRHELSGQMIDH